MEMTIEQLQAELEAEKAKNAELQSKIDALENKYDIKAHLKRLEAKTKDELAYQAQLESQFC